MYRYKVFDLVVESDCVLSYVELWHGYRNKTKVQIQAITTGYCQKRNSRDISFEIDDIGSFLISDGIKIVYFPALNREVDADKLATYFLGPCMGAILCQRGEFVLHGSCVTRNGKTILVTGVSGAGKSTLAVEFLKNGWEMVTDDIALIKGIEEGHPMVQSSYPSQKLWEDAITRYNIAPDKQTLLYTEDNRSKVNVHIDHFHEGLSPLTDIICLYPTEKDCDIIPVTSLAIVDQLMRNTCRAYMIPESQRQQHFQRCVTLSKQIRMHAVLRARERDTAPELYEKIIRATED